MPFDLFWLFEQVAQRELLLLDEGLREVGLDLLKQDDGLFGGEAVSHRDPEVGAGVLVVDRGRGVVLLEAGDSLVGATAGIGGVVGEDADAPSRNSPLGSEPTALGQGGTSLRILGEGYGGGATAQGVDARLCQGELKGAQILSLCLVQATPEGEQEQQ